MLASSTTIWVNRVLSIKLKQAKLKRIKVKYLVRNEPLASGRELAPVIMLMLVIADLD